MAVVSPYISIIILNINGLNLPIKRHRVAGCSKKQDPPICFNQEAHFSSKETHRLKVKGWNKIVHASENQKKVGLATLISDKIDFKQKKKR